ncbi:DNA polymerase III subunit delta [Blastochloris viridis]|uniref:DNA-directed DNA polymerase n=1 Tax=Blastochloris viridis TaxID=1079 RepID=A0A0H5B9X5_BLAVI|nr:DNA polymerase III subunit delta [Blastochloris viridis]ALK10977.1 DNA polymerase III subunit delta [Blastochloris viridis]BAR99037.1 DNA polymerase III delta subunit [Blastochloris viridis]CUU43639.1 DNA polymerase III subunit delta [Blastochloris viridis]
MVAVKPGDADAAVGRIDPARPVMLLFGPDAGLVAERAATAAAAGLAGTTDPFALVRLDGDAVAADPPRLADEAYTIAMFGGRRVIRVRVGSRTITGAVEPLLKEPPRDCVVILEAGDLKRGQGLRELVERSPHGLAIACYADAGRDLDRLIDEELRAANLAIDRDARDLLLSQLGGDRLASRGEVRKLALYAHGHDRVRVEDVEAIVGDASAAGLDEAIDTAFAGDAETADGAALRLFKAGTSPQSLLAAAIRTAIQLHRWRIAVEGGVGVRTVLDNTRPPIHFRRKPLIEQALNAWTAEGLATAVIDLGSAAADARKQAQLAEPICLRSLLALATSARRARRR